MLWRGGPSPLALLLLAGVATACRGRAPAAAPRPRSDEAVRALLKRRITAGASKALVVGIIDPDGKRRAIAEAPPGLRAVEGATVLEIASITRLFTAALLADMVERGEVNHRGAGARAPQPRLAGRRRWSWIRTGRARAAAR